MPRGKRSSIQLTEEQKENLRELIDTYQGAKLVTRLLRWLFVVIVLFIVDLQRISDSVSKIWSNIKSIVVK